MPSFVSKLSYFCEPDSLTARKNSFIITKLTATLSDKITMTLKLKFYFYINNSADLVFAPTLACWRVCS